MCVSPLCLTNTALSTAANCRNSRFHHVLDGVITFFNFIETKQWHNRLVSTLCNEVGFASDNHTLHTELRWLSRERKLCRFFELIYENHKFLGGQMYLVGRKRSQLRLDARFCNRNYILELIKNIKTCLQAN